MVASQRIQQRAGASTTSPGLATPASPPIAPTAPILVGKRGPSRGIVTAKALKASKTGKLSVSVSLKRLAPIGINSELFASEVGVLTRQNAPLDVEKWKEVDDNIKNKICDLVLVIYIATFFSLICFIFYLVLTLNNFILGKV